VTPAGSLAAARVAPPSPGARPEAERGAAALRNAELNRTHSMAAMRARGGLAVRLVEDRRRRLVADAVLRLRPRTVVDVGCEDGWIAEAYAPSVGETLLVDADPAVLARASERGLPRTRTRVADATDAAGLEGVGADVVVLSAILEHLERPALALRATARALAPGGRVVAYVPADGPILAIKACLRRGRLGGLARGVSLEPAPGHLHRFDRRSFASLLRGVGVLERLTFDPVALGYLGVVRVDRPRAA
jgi:SAM-dependent methyltransferase